jgi:ribosomal subunit interface protein
VQITVTARHMPLESTLRDRVGEVLRRLDRIGARVLEATAIFDVVGGRPWVELRLHLAPGQLLVATATADDHRTAVDLVDAKMRRQLRRSRTRPRAQRHAMAS